MSAPAGWYRVPDNDLIERYWDGGQWVGNRRPAGEQTSALDTPRPGPQAAQQVVEPPLSGLAQFLYLISVLVALGAVATGVILITHTTPDCTLNPYSGLDDCSGTLHPYTAAGVGALVGGMVQAVVIWAVGYLVAEVARLKART